jgi:hypothetical protein
MSNSRWSEGNGDWRTTNDGSEESMLGDNHDHVHHYNDRQTGERTAHEKHGGQYSEKVGSSAFGSLIRGFMGWDNDADSSSDCRSDCNNGNHD